MFLWDTSSYDRIWDLDVLRICDMNPIGVWAILWCNHVKARNLNILGVLEWNVHLLSIFYVQVLNYQVLTIIESQSLKTDNKIIVILSNKVYIYMIHVNFNPFSLIFDKATHTVGASLHGCKRKQKNIYKSVIIWI